MQADRRFRSLAILRAAYGTNTWRRVLLHRLGGVLAELREVDQWDRVIVGGSFITRKAWPGDVDVLLDCQSLPAVRFARLARYAMHMSPKWLAIGVSVNLVHASLPDGPGTAAYLLRHDRRGRRRRLVVLAASRRAA
ncbi:MAG TPA: hypothetical protein VHC92_04690 [Rhodanobacteraceae bacterium]|jgi:hypothetical protein|nr:hypothetical protein [Rhodanobacteraceae bacterium]